MVQVMCMTLLYYHICSSLSCTELPKLEVDDSVISQKLRVTNQWKIDVKVSGYPNPEVLWKKNGNDLPSTKHCSIYTEEHSTTIAIYSLIKDDSGTYTVTAKNDAGSVSLDLNLRVIGMYSIIHIQIYDMNKV
jgi:Immunoglobulin I-set domain.